MLSSLFAQSNRHGVAYWNGDVYSPHLYTRVRICRYAVITFAELVPHPPISNCGEQFVIYGTDFRVDRAKPLSGGYIKICTALRMENYTIDNRAQCYTTAVLQNRANLRNRANLMGTSH